MLVVDYDKVLGYCKLYQDGNTFDITICGCNGLFAMVWYDSNNKPMIVNFATDIHHLKRCIGLEKNNGVYGDNLYAEYDDFVLDDSIKIPSYCGCTSMRAVGNVFARTGKNVEFTILLKPLKFNLNRF